MSHTAEYHVTGMTCEHCVRAVATEVSEIVGVTDVTVDLTSGALTVVSETDVSDDEVERAVDEAGYAVAGR